jgi:hypothetical protein
LRHLESDQAQAADWRRAAGALAGSLAIKADPSSLPRGDPRYSASHRWESFGRTTQELLQKKPGFLNQIFIKSKPENHLISSASVAKLQRRNGTWKLRLLTTDVWSLAP